MTAACAAACLHPCHLSYCSMSKLDGLSLHISHQNTPLCAVFELRDIRTMLTQLRALRLTTKQTWVTSPFCWSELALHTHLTCLEVMFERVSMCCLLGQAGLGLTGCMHGWPPHIMGQVAPCWWTHVHPGWTHSQQALRVLISKYAADTGFAWDRVQVRLLPLRYLQDWRPFRMADLAQLSQLRGLHALSVLAPQGHGLALPREGPSGSLEGFQWLQGMTALTFLELDLPHVAGLSSIDACTALQGLELHSVNMCRVELADSEWAAIATLTKLTRVVVGQGLRGLETAACIAALQELKGLQEVVGKTWEASHLLAFKKLPQLTYISGGWLYDMDASVALDTEARATCPQVLRLSRVQGDVPFHAFPGLRSFSQQGTLTESSFKRLTQNCPALEEVCVRVADERNDPHFTSLPSYSSLSDCVSAVNSLSKLERLSVLEYKPGRTEELVALVGAAAVLSQLKSVSLVLDTYDCRDMDHSALMLLGRLQQLDTIELVFGDFGRSLYDGRINVRDQMLMGLLSALCGVPHVRLVLPNPYECDRIDDVAQSMRRLGLPLPERVTYAVTCTPCPYPDESDYGYGSYSE